MPDTNFNIGGTMSQTERNQNDQVDAAVLVGELRRILDKMTETKKDELLRESLIEGELRTKLPPKNSEHFTLVRIIEFELGLPLEAAVQVVLDTFDQASLEEAA